MTTNTETVTNLPEVKWVETKEWLEAELRFLYLGEPLTLPAEEFAAFKLSFYKYFKNIKKSGNTCALINYPVVRFLWFVYLNLDPVQKKTLEELDEDGVIPHVASNLTCHVSTLEQFVDPKKRVYYWDTRHFVDHGLRLPGTKIQRLPTEEIKAIYVKLHRPIVGSTDVKELLGDYLGMEKMGI